MKKVFAYSLLIFALVFCGDDKDGVFVDVEHQYAVIAEIEGEDIDIEQAVAMITGSGYEVTTVFTNRTSDKIEEWKIKGKKDER